MLTESELRQADMRLEALFENMDVSDFEALCMVRGIQAGIRYALESDPTGDGLRVQSLIERGAAAAQTWAELG